MTEGTAGAGATAGPSEQARVADRTRRLLDAVRDVTLEEFRSEDAHFERHSRLGRELLYLVANDGWCRRTTEVVDARQAQFVDTDVIVDVDLAYADHEAFELDAGITWLPLLTLPPRMDHPGPTGPAPADGRSRRGPAQRRRRRGDRDREDPDSLASLEVSDAGGARVHRLPQAEVHQRLAAALAEIILNVMASRALQVADPESRGGEMERDDKLLLSAAIRRLLRGQGERPAERGGTVPAGVRQARARLDDVLSRDVRVAEAGEPPGPTGTATETDGPGPAGTDNRLRPVMGSHVGEILDALIGTTLVVIAVQDPGHPLSYTVRIPSRRLVQLGRTSMWFQPRAQLSIDLLAPTTHADRLIRLTLPDGVICHDGAAGATGRIDVVLPAAFERLNTLLNRLFTASLPADRPATWVDGRIAEMALHTVDAALDSLRHYLVTGVTQVTGVTGTQDRPHDDAEQRTADVDRQLRRLREELAVIRRGPTATGSGPTLDALRRCWDGGSWFPTRLRRRLEVNTASTTMVLMRATAVDEISLRARPTLARIEADVSVSDSTVFNVARYAGAMNMTVLSVLTALLVWDRSDSTLDPQLLATVLTLFSAVQAGRVEHPDSLTLRGLLSRASYWIMLASVLPTILLAMALAVVPADQRAIVAGIALVLQGLLMLRLRRGPLSRWRRGRPARVVLATGHAPDHARVDMLRGKRSRALITEAMLLGREAYAYVVTRPAGEQQFTGLLERTQKDGAREEGRGRVTVAARKLVGRSSEAGGDGPAVTGAANLLGVVQSATAGRAMTYLVFRERPAPGWTNGDADPLATVQPVPLDAERLAPTEPPEWVLDVLVGIPESAVAIPLAVHPLMPIVTDTHRYNYRVTSVQLPAPPPPGGAGRRWMRLRIGISYRRGDSLRGVGRLLHRLHRMDESPFADGTLRVIVRVNAERTARPGLAVSRPLSDKDFDVVPDDEAAGDPSRSWRTLAVTANSRVGLLHDVLTGLAADAGSFRLAGMTAAAVYGQTVLFMVGRDASPTSGDASLRTSLPRRLRPSDRVLVALDQRLTARGLDGPVAGPQLLLRVGLRSPDRPGVLRDTLDTLRAALVEQAPRGVKVDGVDVWFMLLEVVNGRTTRGRFTVRLPGSRAVWDQWTAVDWAAVERAVGRQAALAARAGTGRRDGGRWPMLDFDDTVISTELLRTAVPAPLTPP